ncbi:contactin-associated protein 1-like [Actinia tenebrosa]|uniref:Contactin-associated protein 1-like n=1 Tax=Actinia tenebrosa TaxID=6105 RepID=A0A6P8IVD7_ACTTE|nr:contactin-associated protein 1-like [Actinia tenebrosa]XP_031570932.1 contactin-associated protein 1-like [Actinia tenebrosa]XP_031570933.1 contactin-associated protein 1-like [Actinia tenebrosa]
MRLILPAVITVALLLVSSRLIQGQKASYVYVGCFYDSSARPLPVIVSNLRDAIDWKNHSKTVDTCAAQVKTRGFQYFAIQFYGECWSGKDAGTTFANVGPASETKCKDGVGTSWVNAVYKIVNLPACSSGMLFTPKASSGFFLESTWCSSKNDTSPWLEMIFNGPTRITGIGIQGKYPNHWVTTFILEYSEDGSFYIPYRERGLIRTFTGNTNWYDLQLQGLVNPTEGQTFRLVPKTWQPSHSSACARIRLYGC